MSISSPNILPITSINANRLLATCPACGLLCDDILIDVNEQNVRVLNTKCYKSIQFFEQVSSYASPQINGNPATLNDAIEHAASLLKNSQAPLFAGLSTDVQGFRSIYNITQKSNASLQHINNQSLARNMEVLQSAGWQTTTFTEVKNRADVIVCFGDVATHNPRFFERFVDCDGLFISAKNRQIILIGNNTVQNTVESDTTGLKHASVSLDDAFLLPCRADDLPLITIALRALVAEKALKATQIAGINLSDLQIVADKLKAAKYAVLAWVAKDFDFNHAQLSIQNITETVAILNQTTRAAGLPLGGSDGDTTVNNVNTWLNGSTLDISGLTLENDAIEHDCMVWVNSFSTDKMPLNSDHPLIVLGHSKSRFAKTPDVFIPIATPGLDCSGTLFRVDSAVILPLKKVRENTLPTLRKVVSEIEKLI